ncbi:MAG: hypothetical protein JXR83_04830 [Deltaproteobacteria bacterium]|nr:hypothetical protein [Deltaproteobacteria bacterium]
MRQFAFTNEIQSCDDEAWVLALPGSERFIETGCDQLDASGQRPCALFLARFIPREDNSCFGRGDEKVRAFCADPLRATATGTPLRELMIWQEPTADPGLFPRALGSWVDQTGVERVCAVIDRSPASDSMFSALACVRKEDACAVPPPQAVVVDLRRHFSRPSMAPLPDGRLLITDFNDPIAALVNCIQPPIATSTDLHLPSGISSLLIRRSRPQIVASTAGALWRLAIDGDAISTEQIFARESLPPVPGTLLELWPIDLVFLYAAASLDENGPRALFALDLDAERVMGQATVLEDHTRAILSRHGAAELLVGRRSPAGISAIGIGDGEGSLRTFATVTDTLFPTSIESMAMTTDGNAMLAVDSAGELFVIR